MTRIFTLMVLLAVLIINTKCGAQAIGNKISDGFKFEAAYVGDNAGNLNGGLKNGYCYLGMANLRMLFDTEKAGFWKGTQFYVNAANTHGGLFSENYIGDMQVASNIEAGNHTFIQELWIKQTLGKFEIIVGLQDLNVEFAATDGGGQYLNSSFGILPAISTNIPAPIFPLTSLGLTAKWQLTENTVLQEAIYDGTPSDFDTNPNNLNWKFDNGDGIIVITELQQSTQINQMAGTYKLGYFSHNHYFDKKFNAEYTDSLNTKVTGFYASGDQSIWQINHKSIDVFAQVGFSPSSESLTKSYYGFGINYAGIFSKSNTDVLGLAVACANLNADLGTETTIELTYQRQLTDNIFIQPDFQYIIHPSGKSSDISNCLVGILRIGLSF